MYYSGLEQGREARSQTVCASSGVLQVKPESSGAATAHPAHDPCRLLVRRLRCIERSPLSGLSLHGYIQLMSCNYLCLVVNLSDNSAPVMHHMESQHSGARAQKNPTHTDRPRPELG